MGKREPNREFAPNPLEHLATYGHEKEACVSAYKDLVDDIDWFFERPLKLIRLMQQEGSGHYLPEEKNVEVAQFLDMIRQQLVKEIDDCICVHMMLMSPVDREYGKKEYRELMEQVDTKFEETLLNLFDRTYSKVYRYIWREPIDELVSQVREAGKQYLRAWKPFEEEYLRIYDEQGREEALRYAGRINWPAEPTPAGMAKESGHAVELWEEAFLLENLDSAITRRASWLAAVVGRYPVYISTDQPGPVHSKPTQYPDVETYVDAGISTQTDEDSRQRYDEEREGVKSSVTRTDQSVVIGLETETGGEVSISKAARERSVYVVGIPGTGKSTLLESMAYQDMASGEGLCFLDPHGDSVKKLLDRVPEYREEDVIYWDPADIDRPFGLNPFSVPDPKDARSVDAKADNFISALESLAEFTEIFKSAPLMTNVLRHLAIALIVNQGYTLAEAPEFLENEDYRPQFYPALSEEYPQIRRFWWKLDDRRPGRQEDLVSSSLNKLERFQVNTTMRTIFGQPTNSIDFRQAMDEGKIILVNLAGAPGEGSGAFIGAFVVFEIYKAAKSREDLAGDQRRPFHIFADEFQTFMSTAFPKLIEECRKYKVDTVIAHQHREGQLSDRAKGSTRSAGNLIMFRINAPDARDLAGEFDLTPPEPEVTGERPKYEVAPNPLEHLATHGHENSRVVEGYRTLEEMIDEFFEKMFDWIGERTDVDVAVHFDGLSVRQEFGSVLAQKKAKFRREVNQILHENMRAEDDEEAYKKYSVVKWGISRAVRDAMAKLLDTVTQARVHRLEDKRREWEDYKESVEYWRKIDKEEIANKMPVVVEPTPESMAEEFKGTVYNKIEGYLDGGPAVWKSAFEIVEREWDIRLIVEELAYLLYKNPCMVPTGQLEPIVDKPRLYSDVGAQIANELANLPKYQARCKLTTETGPQEGTIKTMDLVVPSDTARAERIKKRSREKYGRNRRTVEQEIEKRLEIRTTTVARSATLDRREHPNAEPEQDEWLES